MRRGERIRNAILHADDAIRGTKRLQEMDRQNHMDRAEAFIALVRESAGLSQKNTQRGRGYVKILLLKFSRYSRTFSGNRSCPT